MEDFLFAQIEGEKWHERGYGGYVTPFQAATAKGFILKNSFFTVLIFMENYICGCLMAFDGCKKAKAGKKDEISIRFGELPYQKKWKWGDYVVFLLVDCVKVRARQLQKLAEFLKL